MRADRSFHNHAQAKSEITNNNAAENISLCSGRCTERKMRTETAFYLVRPSEVNLTTSSEYVCQSCTESEKLCLSF